ncbi:FtsX-like permease family protein [Actinobaculum sp. 352]|uniref:FtsX-like permease family protein n=2 Tax=unclassified Actinobaculum TaxID=2609299 RepID=UPI000F7F3AF6|nr:FtsX-like permease family protein [Actinobaculum sp. 352]RTE48027.1 FtsX-like permease family protein [Actinobaculum sp. 352]
MNQVLHLTPHLTAARLRTRTGDALLDVLAVLSFMLSTLMALTLAGGIWMFKSWNDHPEQFRNMGEMVERYAPSYYVLALFAGALLVIPIATLGASAARLGARGRSERLASLRLIGVTSGQTVAITVVETLVQWVVGATIGTFAYFLTLPLWHNISFLKTPINAHQMLLPVWLLAIILAGLLLITLASTVVGLSRVRISPLGVARREASPALRHWRPILFVVVIAAFIAWAQLHPQMSDGDYLVTVAVITSVMIGSVYVVGPWVLQLLARPATKTRSASTLLAMRRILDDPRAAWRAVGALALLSFIAGFVSVIGESSGPDDWFFTDVVTGVYITIGFGFAVTALSTLMNQSSSVFDRAPETHALAQTGFPTRMFGMTRFNQVVRPLFLATVVTGVLGVALGSLAATEGVEPAGIIRLAIVTLAGIGLTLLALAACEPLERHVLAAQRRRND